MIGEVLLDIAIAFFAFQGLRVIPWQYFKLFRTIPTFGGHLLLGTCSGLAIYAVGYWLVFTVAKYAALTKVL